jgi:hypothetical protein
MNSLDIYLEKIEAPRLKEKAHEFVRVIDSLLQLVINPSDQP